MTTKPLTPSKSTLAKLNKAWKLAVQEENLPELKKLLLQGANIEYCMSHEPPHGKMTAVQIACLTDWAPGALWLINQGAQLGMSTPAGSSALSFAVSGDELEVVEAILQRDTSNINVVSVFGVAPLHLAILEGSQEMVEALLSAGADIHVCDESGDNALKIALEKDDDMIINMIRCCAASKDRVVLDDATAAAVAPRSPSRM